MAMKKIKPQYGKVIAPVIKNENEREVSTIEENSEASVEKISKEKQPVNQTKSTAAQDSPNFKPDETSVSGVTGNSNPFLQTKEVFAKARLTKIGYRMRTEYVEVLDILKKIKRNGYTLEAVLDDALTFYFENSEDGKEALKKAEIFYS
jgi:hypothetical protein